MPSYFPENNTPLALDTETKSLQKINDLLSGGITVSVGEVEVKNDAGHPVPVSPGAGTSFLAAGLKSGVQTAIPLDAANGFVQSRVEAISTGSFGATIQGFDTVTGNPFTNCVPVKLFRDSAGVIGNVGGTVNASCSQSVATNLKTQAENYQGGSPVGSSNPLQVTLANTGANATAVKVDGSAVTQPVSDRGATGTVLTTFNFTSSTTLASSSPNRKLLAIFNEGAGNLHVLYGSGTASTTNYSVRLSAGDYLEIEKYTGQVNAIFATAGTARVTEIT